jgi:hypothetical protein
MPPKNKEDKTETKTEAKVEKIDSVVEGLIEDIIGAQNTASTQMEDVPVSIRPAIEMRKEQASKALPVLMNSLWAQTPRRLVAVSVGGDQEFLDEAAKLIEGSGIVFGVGAFWDRVASEIEPSMGLDRIYRMTQHHILVNIFTAAKQEYNEDFRYASAFLPQFSEICCPTHSDLVNHIRTMVAEADRTYPQDSKMLTSALKSTILKETVKSDLCNHKVPVLLLNPGELDIEEFQTLFAKHSEAVLKETPTLESLINLFKNSKG